MVARMRSLLVNLGVLCYLACVAGHSLRNGVDIQGKLHDKFHATETLETVKRNSIDVTNETESSPNFVAYSLLQSTLYKKYHGIQNCPPGTLKCSNGRCIALSSLCDGIEDCDDGSDEASCRSRRSTNECGPNTCTADNFQCTNGQWINRNWMCDGDRDCRDGTDELDCLNRECLPPRFKCRNTGRCIQSNWRCDGDDDCHDGSDEAGCSTGEPRYETAYACEGKTLKIGCSEGSVIHLIRANYGRFSITICNDHGNTDWSVNCMSTKSLRVFHSRCSMQQNCSILASTNMFGDPCPNTLKYLEAHYQCVPASTTSTTNRPSPPWLITSQPTVWRSTAPPQPKNPVQPPTGERKKPTVITPSTFRPHITLPPEVKIGDVGSKKTTTKLPETPPEMLPPPPVVEPKATVEVQKVIEPENRPRNDKPSRDREDNECGPNTCTADRFQCTSGQWIIRNYVCDGDRDCGDGSDELDCLHRNCSSTRFKCANTGRCVPMSWHCDGADDCHDGSDEAGCTHGSPTTPRFSECGSNTCTADRFQCTSGQWINRNWMCDGDRDCGDGSDELDCAHRNCSSSRFKCANTGRCVPMSWHCDGADDCHDGSDEANCSSNLFTDCGSNNCTATQFQCGSGQWITRRFVCDGDRDCHDGSDEHDCLHRNCSSTRFKCANTGRCVPMSWHCDGTDDCHDGSDEAGCTSGGTTATTTIPQSSECGSNTCTADRFQCTSGQWINRSWMCDGDRDCGDGSDELDCAHRICSSTRFKCANTGRCVPLSWHCDGADDCHDGSDEANCPSNLFPDCGSNNCTGTRFQCNNGNWINRRYVCDGDRDCSDGSDEHDCLHRNCSSTRFKCANTGRCVPMSWHCDGADDCHDGSDEVGCTPSTNTSSISGECGSNTCTADRFQCTNGRWISRNWMCDGDRDCTDGSDEQDCVNRVCSSSRFKCANTGRCVPMSWHCDGADDCHDGSDEAGCSSPSRSTTSIYPECGSNTCTADRFQCNNGHWINRNYICDGDRDCTDASDEQDCAHRPCPSTKFKCANTGRCVPVSWRCDGTDDCHDGSDEAGCPTPQATGECGSNTCSQDRFQCTNGQWINRNWMCDGDRDCNDGSDEHDCMHRNCSSTRFKCANTGRCIPLSWHCDGADDCHDGGSDEVECSPPTVSIHSGECGSNVCTADRFQCTNGRWINRNWVCDGDRDCTDGSDEYDCAHRNCSSSRFKCANTGRCVPMSWRCDGADDCHDGSDEAGCSTLPPGVYLSDCGSNNCTADRFQCNNGNWITRNYICDGDRDCFDGSDEQDCLHRNCSSTRFKCANTGRCVPMTWRCDGADDCHDGSDEVDCPSHLFTDCGTNNCTNAQFQCSSGQWIPRRYVCDGDRDCHDGSDEYDCLHRNCSSTRFKCANTGRCVPMSWHCDGDDDCHDGSDEAGCSRHTSETTSEYSSPRVSTLPTPIDCSPDSSNCTRFHCNNGQWINRNYVCDGDRDCTDGSDENDCLNRICPSTKFKCANTGRCIPLPWHCDGADDCHDESDEIGCPSHLLKDCGSNNCTLTQFHCNNGQWIRRNYVCDGDRDCSDGSDENGCLNRNCPSNKFKCANTGRCIPLSWHCDGGDDCHDGSDEVGCSGTVSETSTDALAPDSTTPTPIDCSSDTSNCTRFHCNNGQWINKNYVCDGDRDCTDGSDEYDCLHRACPPTKFKCANTGRCVPMSWHCDGADDCHDDSDEIGCPSHIYTDCGSNNCTVTQFQCNNGQWTRRNYVCDGDRDCSDGSDENDCLNRNCSSRKFKCANTGRCVPIGWHCDGADDCHDGSDEVGCSGTVSETSTDSTTPSPIDCSSDSSNCTRFRCNDGQWINKNYVCDGDRDCTDGSDEHDCLHRVCPPTKFKCANTGRCVPASWRCDAADDCHDESDEIGCPNHIYNGCGSNNCTTSRFQCNNGQWITRNYVCDGDRDCSDGSDEYDCLHRTCSSRKFKCANTGRCVPRTWRCDGADDCHDGSDEVGCSGTVSETSTDAFAPDSTTPTLIGPETTPEPVETPTEPVETTTEPVETTTEYIEPTTVNECISSDFRCSNGQCVNQKLVCDGENDCVDGSDEAGCATSTTAPSTTPEPELTDTTVTDSTVTDSTGSQFALECTVHPHFQCYNGLQCINDTFVCDGEKDCTDGSDEKDCENFICPSTRFHCPKDQKCVPMEWRCDGLNDCSDNWDELSCPPRDALDHNTLVQSRERVILV